MRRRVGPGLVALAVAGALVTSGCSSSSATSQSKAHTDLVVLAAASLRNVFATEAAAFHRLHPNVTVTFSFAGSQVLVAQVRAGAPADVLATADEKSMAAVRADLASAPVVFARNRLVVVVRPGNPRHVRTLADLRRVGVVLAAPSVPAGRYARAALAAAGVVVHPVALASDVRAVLTDVELGEADAGIVYVTDARVAGHKVSTVAVPHSPVAVYPVAVLRRGPAAQEFVAFLRSAAGQRILRAAGFLAP